MEPQKEKEDMGVVIDDVKQEGEWETVRVGVVRPIRAYERTVKQMLRLRGNVQITGLGMAMMSVADIVSILKRTHPDMVKVQKLHTSSDSRQQDASQSAVPRLSAWLKWLGIRRYLGVELSDGVTAASLMDIVTAKDGSKEKIMVATLEDLICELYEQYLNTTKLAQNIKESLLTSLKAIVRHTLIKWDKTNATQISFREFQHLSEFSIAGPLMSIKYYLLVHNAVKPISEPDLKDLWNNYDNEKTNSIDRSEIKNALRDLLTLLDKSPDLKAFIASYDTSYEGRADFGFLRGNKPQLDWNEFMSIITILTTLNPTPETPPVVEEKEK